MLFFPFLHGLFHLVILLLPGELLVREVHVVHIMCTGVVTNLQARIVAEEFLKLIFHGQDAADDDRRPGIYPHRTVEDGRETLVHPPCYLSVLLCTQGCQFAPSVVRFCQHPAYLRYRFLSLPGEDTCRVGPLQYLQGAGVLLLPDKIA